MAITYNLKQISRWLGSHTVAKGMGYLRAVSDLRWENAVLCGSVKGTQRYPYQARAYFSKDEPSTLEESECTCPVSYDCKHVAALLLLNLQKPATTGSGVRQELATWLEHFRAHVAPAAKPRGKAAASQPTHRLVYAFSVAADGVPGVHIFKSRRGADDETQTLEALWNNIDAALVKPMTFVAAEDLPILRTLRQHRQPYYSEHFALSGADGAAVIERIVATGRAIALEPGTAMLFAIRKTQRMFRTVRPGPARPARLHWETDEHARIKPVLELDPPASLLFMTQPCWYVDADSGEAGMVDTPWPAESLAPFLSMPSLLPTELPVVAAVLAEVAPHLPLPESGADSVPTVDTAATPVLRLDTQSVNALYRTSLIRSSRENALDFATLHFDYAGHVLHAGSSQSLVNDAQGQAVYIKRHAEQEQKAHDVLRRAGLKKLPRGSRYAYDSLPDDALVPRQPADWHALMQTTIPALRENGWRVEMSHAFSFNVIEIEDIDGSLRQTDGGWFDVEMGITVGDRVVRLEPLLAALFARDKRWLSGQLEQIPDEEAVELHTDRNERLHIRAARLKPVVRALIDLFDGLGGEAPLRVSALDAGRLQALDDTGRWQFHGDASVRELAHRLSTGDGITPTAPPKGLRATLRAYQQQGLDWMQYLRANQLSGVLADDMGLGKTLQALAHILAEKEAGRLDRPALVLLPTSLMYNWRDEAERFAPSLRVLDLHGPQRHERSDQIAEHDIVLTTYALLWRDQAILSRHDYHLLILDEAQYVKNASSKSATIIRELRARHRLCLTGTPLENHLGELWAQFDFLLPGLLGSQKEFTRRWRNPIEKEGDAVRRDLLVRRIRPFILRRRKDEVATELPPKTIIVRSIELEGGQRDLYESVRSAMQKKVRDAIAKQGMARSHIVVLDALLKLRQVCCDPRLVKIGQAKQVKESAKLDSLLDMLPALIDEGRRILLFSQFTSMLTLIAKALDRLGIPYLMLTGETTNRAALIKRFTHGDTPLFLISLKAGGVGLNLTAADTVIHYDPWWNPAVENQATDRAHRIGQDKPVFVYKLITSGSIEEKIVAMQERKAALADAILAADGADAGKFTAADIEALFEPIPELAEVGKKARKRS